METDWNSVHLPYKVDGIKQRRHSYRVDALVRLAAHALQGIEKPRILDVGSGRGEFLAAAIKHLDAKVTSIDIDPVCIEIASQYGQALCGTLPDVFNSPENELINSMDLVVSSHSLEHIPDPIGYIDIMKKISCDHLLFAVPNPHFLPDAIRMMFLNRILPTNKGHYWCWDVTHFSWFLQGMMGLEVIEWGADWVQILPAENLYQLPGVLPIVARLESKLIPRLFPRLAESLIALCRKSRNS